MVRRLCYAIFLGEGGSPFEGVRHLEVRQRTDAGIKNERINGEIILTSSAEHMMDLKTGT